MGVSRFWVFAAALCVISALTVLPVLAEGTISGIVSTDEPGSPALSGAVVSTDGDPSYSAATGSDGAYSLPLPGGTYYLLACASGRVPQRVPVTVADGGATTANFSLRPASVGLPVDLPAPTNWGEPAGAPMPPGDSYPVAFTNAGAQPLPGAPIISESNRIVKPDETFTLSGVRFTARAGTDAGTDTIVWVWARTGPDTGVLRQARVWRVTESVLTALMPDDVPFGDYLVWVQNEVGASAPIVLNKTYAKWVGPFGSSASPGETKRVFGRNISYNHGSSTSYVYVQPVAGGAFVACAVTKVEPYTVSFDVPSGLGNGNYRVYVHNGHGGVYGWSDPLDLTIVTPWVRGAATRSLSPSGGDDSTAIQSAVDQLTALPNGGTVLLSAGNFILTRPLTMKSNVEIKGAGMDSTYLLLQLAASANYGIDLGSASHCAFTDLTYRDCHGYAQLNTGEMNAYWGYDTKFTRYRQIADRDTESRSYGHYFLGGYRTEIADSEFWRCVTLNGTDGWLHNTTMYGDRYWGDGWAALYCQNDRNIIEYNHFETKDWPVNPDNGSVNYLDWMPDSELFSKIWAKRLGLTYCSDMYLAHSTTKDVAVQDNQGEMILFHGMGATWWGNVISNSGRVATLRTDGTVDGTVTSIVNYSSNPLYGGGGLSPSWAGQEIIIISGRGIGQLRKIASVSGSTVTVEKPWSVQPDGTSVAVIHGRMYVDNIVYQNDLNALPPNYTYSVGASTGWDIDGNGFSNSFEGNVSHRTYNGRWILANSGGPTFWNEAREEQALSIGGAGGLAMFMWDTNPKGSLLLGNAFRNSQVEVLGATEGAIKGYGGEGNVFEGVTATGKRGIYGFVGGVDWQPYWPYGMTLYRKNIVTTIDEPASPTSMQPAGIYAPDMNQWFAGNTYTNSTQPYTMLSGSLYSTPVAMRKSLRFVAYAGYSADEQIVPVANVGVTGMSWTATSSDSWVTASISSGNPTGAESDMGRVVVAVNPAGKSVGRYWGSITITAGAKSEKVGVCLDVLAGIPPQAPPIAAFTASKTAGTAPVEVSFDGRSSVDSDGIITSYYWDFGDGTYGAGAQVSHTYSQGSYTAVLTVSDDDGAEDTARTAMTVYPPLTSVSLVGTPSAPTSAGTTVTLTATAVGGYLPRYKFLIRSGSAGWTTLQDYSSSNTATWTPASGYYEIKCYARASDSTRVYDAASPALSYPVGVLPASGIAFWLRADTGVSTDGSGKVTEWLDQTAGSAKKLTQTEPGYRPALLAAEINGRSVVRFTGGYSCLSTTSSVLSGSGGFTTFTVARANSLPRTDLQYLWWCGDASSTGGFGPWLSLTDRIRSSWGSSSGMVSTPSTSPAVVGVLYTITSRYGSGTHQMWINGASIGTTSKSDSSILAGFSAGNNAPAGGYQGFYGDLAEVLIYSRSLSDAEKLGVEQYLSSRWTPQAPVLLDRLKDVKSQGDGVAVSISSPKVATVASGVYSDESVYISEPDRTCGMKITGVGTVDLWDNLTLSGTTDTDVLTGERVLRVTSVSKVAGTELNSLGMNGKTVTASGQLVRVWGKVKEKTSSYLTLDDGSGVTTKVQIDGLVTSLTTIPSVGDYMSATGPCTTVAGGVTAVRVRSGSDIRVY